MLDMSQINHIKDLSNCGYRISEINEKTGVDPKTIRKYLSQDDFSPLPPIAQQKPSKLDPFKPVIQEWLDEDKKHWRKQHHTAQRVYERLVEEYGYTGSYSVVQRYIKKCRTIRTEKANLELIWDPGPAQVDFGETDVYESGKLCRKNTLPSPSRTATTGTVSCSAVRRPNASARGFWISSNLSAECLHCWSLTMQPASDGGSVMRFMNRSSFPGFVPTIISVFGSAIPTPAGRKEM